MNEINVINKDGVREPIDLEKIYRVISWASEGLFSDPEINSPVFFKLLDFERLPSWLNQFILALKTVLHFVFWREKFNTVRVLYNCSYRTENAISWTKLLKMTVRLGGSPPYSK